MTFLDGLILWMQANEAVLSGAAAAIAIAGFMSTWCLRLVQQAGLARHLTYFNFAERISELPLSEPRQEIRFTAVPDGSSIAYASSGATKGIPIVRSLGWFTHLEAEWAFSQGRSLWSQIGKHHPLYRYDGRGIGLSTCKSDFTPNSPLEDLEAVIDAAELDKVVLFGLSEGGMTAVQYAAKHPERVSHLILYGTFLNMLDWPEVALERWATLFPLMQRGWGAEDPAARQLFTSQFLPDGNRAQNHYFNEMQRASCNPEQAMNYITSSILRDVSAVAEKVEVPTLVLHREGDLCVPVQAGRAVAKTVPNAQFELLPGNNHWMLALEDDSEYVIDTMETFIKTH